MNKALCIHDNQHVTAPAAYPHGAVLLKTVGASGGSNGKIVNFDLTSGEQVSSFQAASDTVNGFQFHPYLPLSATASGEAFKPP